MSDLKALFLDISGVIYDNDILIPGAKETIAAARRRGLTLRFITNTASKSSAEIVSNLCSLGINIDISELITAPSAAKQYVVKRELRPFVLLSGAVLEEFYDINQERPNCVILGDARDQLNYKNLNQVFRLCHNGARLIAVGMNKYFLGADGLQLDAGGFVKAIEWASG